MLTRLFKKRGASGKGQQSRPAVSTSVKKLSSPDEAPILVDLNIDEAMEAIHARLSQLPQIDVTQAAKERGWAKLQRELERRPVRSSAPAPLKDAGTKPVLSGGGVRPVPAGHGRGWRMAVGSLVAAVAVVIAVLGSYGAGVFTVGGTPSTLAVTNPVTTQTRVTVGTSETTPVTGGSTTEVTPGASTTGVDNTTTVTTGTTPTSQGGTTASTGGTSATNSASTTVPQLTTTTNLQQYTTALRENKAEKVALDLGDAVVRARFGDGDLTGVRSLVADSAQAGLIWMISSLKEPTGFMVVAGSTKILSSDTVRVTLEFTDGDNHPRFYLTVRVSDGGAVITGISRGL